MHRIGRFVCLVVASCLGVSGCSAPADESPSNPPPSGGTGGTPDQVVPDNTAGGGMDSDLNPMPTAMGMPTMMPPPADTTMMDPMPMPNPTGGNMPTVEGEIYKLQTGGNVFLEANGSTGRITSLRLDATELLTSDMVNALNYGSSFWTSPQDSWGWPPPLDDTTYTHAIDGDSVLFTSAPTVQGTDTVSITKRFRAMASHLELEYTITNGGSAAIQVAPWEITRVRSSGISFYPSGSVVTKEELATTAVDGITWLDYDNAGINGTGLKNVTDGAEGWLAHVDQGVLFLKRFDDIPAEQQAPAEGEIEIYADGARDYVELEQQGAYVTLEAGQTSAPWKVLWIVEALPPDMDVSLGSAALVEYVRGL